MCDESFFENKILYCYYKNVWFVGDNSTNDESKATAVRSISDVQGTLIIPKLVRSHRITQVAFCAFYKCSYIKRIIIEADITVLNYRSFSNIYELEYIRLPKTIEYLYGLAIDLFDYTINGLKSGITTVVFQKNTHLKYIGVSAFNRKTFFVICIGNDINPVSYSSTFYSATTLLIKSPQNYTFVNINSQYISEKTYLSLCGKDQKDSNNFDSTTIHSFLFLICCLL